MESTIFSGFWPLRVRWEWPRAPHPVLIFDGIEGMVYVDFEQSEVGFFSVGLGRVP